MPKPPAPRKKSAKRKKKSTDLLLPIAIWAFLVITLAALFYFIFLRPHTSPNLKKTAGSIHRETPLHFEEPDTSVAIIEPPKKIAVPPKTNTIQKKDAPRPELPLIAIVIDDMGFRKKFGAQFINLDLNLSFAFLPYGPYSASQANDAGLAGRDVLLHLPMEPTSTQWDPGPGALLLSMSKKDIHDRVKRDLAAIPMAIGINNHMGSRFTQNREAMHDFLEIVQQKDLFFLDSMTSHNSVGYYVAQKMGIKSGKRNVFLDNERDKTKIKQQLQTLLKLAEKKGWAIGIGHPYEETLAAITDYRSTLQDQAKIVNIHKLMH
ncbi:MAG: divergent polysaccharide deacetylase family protein [Proteobacteria bacterium]|nr:divergent polysaccharide deacetylase family protein [Pseudomonadota bacterium]MBU1713992.1 divergent polysaccharide deacetylase family protein [Pseudomonadota bacterium]